VVWDYFYTFLKCHLYYTVVVFVNVYLLELKEQFNFCNKKKEGFFFIGVFLGTRVNSGQLIRPITRLFDQIDVRIGFQNYIINYTNFLNIFYTILFYFITMLELKKEINRKASKMDPSDGTLLHTAGQLLAHESHRPHLISLIVKSFSFKGLTFQRHHLLIPLPVPLISCGLTFHLRALAR